MLGIESTIELNNGQKIPRLGLGVWQIPDGPVAVNAIKTALEVGYRHIDTAHVYHNERSVGRALAESEIAREKIWVTTKLFPLHFYRYKSAFNTSLEKMGLDYVDCYLVHFPIPLLYVDLWRKVERLMESGRVRSIGVSNYGIRHLKALKQKCSITPQVNQIHLNPFHCNWDLVNFCRDNDIAVEAYSPLAHGKKLQDSRLTEIANSLGVTPAQVLIRWALENDFIVIPKSSNPDRIKANSEVFHFSLPAEVKSELDRIGVTSKVL